MLNIFLPFTSCLLSITAKSFFNFSDDIFVDRLFDAYEWSPDDFLFPFSSYDDVVDSDYYLDNIDKLGIEEYFEDEDQKIVKRKEVYLKPVDEEEAITQMELLGHSFFVFKNVDTNKINVVYKRNDGDYGVIEAN